MATERIVNNPDGTKAILSFFDENDNIVDEEKGSKVVIRELDKSGNIVNEIWGSYSSENKK